MSNPTQQVSRAVWVHSSRGGKYWLYLFLLLVLLALVGALSIVWPIVTVELIPKTETIALEIPLKLDLDITQPNQAARLVPGYTQSGLPQTHVELVEYATPAGAVFADRALVTAIAETALAEATGDSRQAVPGTLRLVPGQASVGPGGRSFQFKLKAEWEVYPNLALQTLAREIAGHSFKQGLAFLRAEPGVSDVRISVFPLFFANLSQKFPKQASRLNLRLDIPAKPSILK